MAVYRVSGFLNFSVNLNWFLKIELFVIWYTGLNEALIESDQSVSSSEKSFVRDKNHRTSTGED